MAETTVATLLFTDLVDSTALSQRLGEDRAEELRRSHTQTLRDAVARSGGREVKHMGDGIMVAFASPSDALRCAVGMQQRVEIDNRKLSDPLGLRVGLHVGEVTEESGDYFGTPVVVAERLCKRADGGQIFTTDILRALVGTRGDYRFKELGPLELKGIDEAVQAFEVHWAPVAEQGIPLPSFFLSIERPFYVGRTDEYARLRNEWQEARAGQRHVALVVGEPGIGKTRMCTELAFEAYGEGAVVLYGRCDEDPSVPYQPFAEALRHYVLHAPEEELRAHVADHGGELTRLVSELAKRVPDAPPPIEPQRADPTADREVERYRLFEAAAGVIALSTSARPIVLVLDDLHWATRPTLLMLRHLLRAGTAMPLLVVGTYRDTDLARTHPLAEMLADWRRELDPERISLGGLSESGVLEFVKAAAGETSEQLEGLARELHAETEGNPFFTGQVLRHLVESGVVFRENDVWTFRGSVKDLRIPEGVREVIGRRLSRLSRHTNKALAVAAVIGGDFDAEVLESVPEATEDGDVLDALDEAVDARVLAEIPDRRGRYRFAHTLIRHTLYEELSSARRARIHRAVGEAIESYYAAEIDRHVGGLARHFCEGARAGDVEKAANYAVRAAKKAIEGAAYEEAIEHAEHGLQVLELDDNERTEARASLLVAIVSARFNLLDMNGIDNGFEAMQLALRANLPEVFASAAAYTGMMAPFARRSEEFLTVCDQARSIVTESFPDARVQLIFAVLWVRQNLGLVLDNEELSVEALELARRSGDALTLAFAAYTRSMLFGGPSDTAELLALCEELLVRASDDTHPDVAATAYRLRRVARLGIGDVGGFLEDSTSLGAIGRLTRNGVYQVVERAAPATVAFLEGRFDVIEPTVRSYMEEWGHTPVIQVAYAYRMIALRFEIGELDGAVRMAQRLVAAAPTLTPAHSLLALCLAHEGDTEEAAAELDLLTEDEFRRPRASGERLTVFAALTEVCAVLGDTERVRKIYDVLPHKRTRELIIFGDGWWCPGAIDRTAAVLAGLLERWDEAEERFETALDFESSVPAPAIAARTRYAYARMLDAKGDRHRAIPLLDACIADARSFGMKDLAAKAEALRAR